MVYVNGQFVPDDQATVSVFDRGFLYGDSVFETVLISNRRLFRWHQHLERLQRGTDYLRIKLSQPGSVLRDAARRLIEQNQIASGLLRLTVSRGVGPHGYSPEGANSPTVVMTTYEQAPADPAHPPAWKMITSQFRLTPADRLASHKTGSKLLQVMAAIEAKEAGADEALLVNTNGEVAEGSRANVFWVRGPVVYTSPTAVGVLPGITRAIVLEICAAHNIVVKKRLTKVEMLKTSDAVFLTNSAHGLIDVVSLDDHQFAGSTVVQQLRERFFEVVQRECGG